jgi:hypothetical protein
MILLSFGKAYSQEALELFPDKLNIQPFAANMLEPKLGASFKTNNNELSLNIGNSLDMLQYKVNEKTTASFGADLFTYTFLRGEKDFHFPVDAVDYLFGFNAGYKTVLNDKEQCGIRFRLSHISAHFVDGHFDGNTHQWRDNHSPRVYSREFIELTPFYKYNGLRTYAMFIYIFHIDPEELHKDNYQIGFDYYYDKLAGGKISPYIGYDFKLIHNNKYTANNSFVAGVKFGHAFGRGFSIFYQYYSGNSIHGEYYDYKNKYSAIGFNLDL